MVKSFRISTLEEEEEEKEEGCFSQTESFNKRRGGETRGRRDGKSLGGILLEVSSKFYRHYNPIQ